MSYVRTEYIKKEDLTLFIKNVPISLSDEVKRMIMKNHTGEYFKEKAPKNNDFLDNLVYAVNEGSYNFFQSTVGCPLSIIEPRYKASVILAIHFYSVLHYKEKGLENIKNAINRDKIPKNFCLPDYEIFLKTLQLALEAGENKCKLTQEEMRKRVQNFGMYFNSTIRPQSTPTCLGAKDFREVFGYASPTIACKAKPLSPALTDPSNKLTNTVCEPLLREAAKNNPNNLSQQLPGAAGVPGKAPDTPKNDAPKVSPNPAEEAAKKDGDKNKELKGDASSETTDSSKPFNQTKMIAIGAGAAAGAAILLAATIHIYRKRSISSMETKKGGKAAAAASLRRTTSVPNIGTLYSHGSRLPANVILAYEPRMDDELRLKEGDEVIIFEEFEDGYAYGENQRNERGIFPIMCLNNSNTRYTVDTALVGGQTHESYINPKKARYTEYADSII
ncbi:hypothetical protein HMI55_001120 [Coelomomyces lativittatus]|nr:hypothetical protein HMI56_001307 [Coelomomyces lativittatus]KAJ1516901.1 hypothetical protein HMI55_001120 [Coelomomyces lativittatus]